MSAAPRAFKTPADFRAWLEKNGAKARELLLRLYKVHARDKGMTYKQALDEALCFGWIDGVRRQLDADTFEQRFSPRKARSAWSKVNTKRMRELIAEGRVQPVGMAAFERGTPSKYSFESRPAALDPALERRFRADRKAWAFWQTQPPGRRRLVLHWVTSAKQEATRLRRLDYVIERLARGQIVGVLEKK